VLRPPGLAESTERRQEWGILDGQDDPIQYVLSKNLHRRHLTDSQKAALALKLEPYFAEKTRKQQLAGLKQFADNKPHAGQFEEEDTVREKIPQRGGDGKARTQAGKALGVNRQYVADAKRISKEAPALIPKIETGEVTIQQAKQVIKARRGTMGTGVLPGGGWGGPLGHARSIYIYRGPSGICSPESLSGFSLIQVRPALLAQ
jgi:hypothetical protein